VHRYEEALYAAVLTCLPAETAAGLDALLKAPAAAMSGEVGRAPLLALRAGAGPASLQSVGEEADKLARIRALALPADLFAKVPSKVLLAYRRRVAAEELHELRRHCQRQREDACVDKMLSDLMRLVQLPPLLSKMVGS